MLHKTMSFALVVTMLSTMSTPAYLVEITEQEVTKQSERKSAEDIEQLTRAIESIRSQIDSSQFDLEALLEKLEYEPERIVSFVSQNIYFEQYEGLLRGAQGTLMSRAGNSLDQAILAATLLNDAGADARIVVGKIGASDTAKLIELMFRKRSAPAPVFATVAADAASTNSQAPSGLSSRLMLETMDKFEVARSRAVAIAEELKQHLQKANLSLASVPVTDEMSRSAQEYFWVEYRLGASEPWLSAHPAFHGATPVSLERKSVLVGDIPENLQHRLRIEVEIEQQLGGKLIRKHVMGPWERPVVNLIGRQFTYTNYPSGMTSPDDFDIYQVARDTQYFLPLLNGEPAPNAQTFDLNGVIAPPDVTASAAAGIFREVGSKTESAASALSGLGKSTTSDIRSLVSQSLIYTLVRPGGEEEVIRRTVYLNESGVGDDSPESHEQRRLEATWKLAGVETFVVSPGDYPEAYILDRLLKEALGLSTLLDGEVQRGDSEDDGAGVSPEFSLFSMMAAGLPQLAGRTSFVASPEIVGRWQRVIAAPNEVKLESSVDIVAQGRQVFEREGTRVSMAREANLQNGVWATLAETLVPHADPQGKTAISAGNALEEAKRANVTIKTMAPNAATSLDGLDLPEGMKRSIADSLAKGYVVLIPERLEQGMNGGWWRFDPTTGETLGLGREGRGQHTLEEMVVLSVLAYLIIPKLAGLAAYTVCLGATDCSNQYCMRLSAKTMLVSVLVAGAFAAVAIGVTFGGTALSGAGAASAGGLGSAEVPTAIAGIVHAIEGTGIAVDLFKAGYGTGAAAAECQD